MNSPISSFGQRSSEIVDDLQVSEKCRACQHLELSSDTNHPRLPTWASWPYAPKSMQKRLKCLPESLESYACHHFPESTKSCRFRAGCIIQFLGRIHHFYTSPRHSIHWNHLTKRCSNRFAAQ